MKNSLQRRTNANFDEQAWAIHQKHRSQTRLEVDGLNQKYETTTIFPKPIKVWAAIEKLAFVCDPTDKELYAVSQWVHTTQVIEGMEKDAIQDEWLIVAGWLHDLGKALLLTKEDPANIVCDNFIIEGQEGAGLDNCLLQWNHDEFIYLKMKDKVPEDYLWLMRYHSINVKSCEKYFDDRDRRLATELLLPFKKYDKGTKSMYHFPMLDLEPYQKLIEKYFPKEVIL